MRMSLLCVTLSALVPVDAPAADGDYAALRERVLALGELRAAPTVHPAEGFAEGSGIKAIYYEGLPWEGKATRVFAWLGIPEGGRANLPGIVLVHGGGGTAFREWVALWNAHGFAAISIAVEGQTDVRIEGAPPGSQWERHEWAGPARDGIFADSDAPLKDQWIYHAVSDTVLANSLLRSQPEVDPEHVGVMGISWGGVVTSTVIGIDGRFAFAIPTYGCGHLFDAANQWGRALGENALYREVWDPMVRMDRVHLPVLWLSWPGDQHFPLDCQSACYRAAPGPRMVSLVWEMGHSHPAGWNPPDSYAFAESVVQDGKPWLREVRGEVEDDSVKVVFDSRKRLDNAVLVWSADAGFTGSRKWEQAEAMLAEEAGRFTVRAVLPARARAWFVNVRAGDLTGSSAYSRREDGELDPAYYNKHLVPAAIADENAAREARYLETLAQRQEERLHRLTSSTEELQALRGKLVETLGLCGAREPAEFLSSQVWNWRSPWRTQEAEVQGQSVPRTSRRSYGLMRRIVVTNPFGPPIEALALEPRDAGNALPLVVCLPEVNPQTNLAGRKEDLAGSAIALALAERGFRVVAVDLPALRDLSEVETITGLLKGEPVLGRMAAELSVLVSALQGLGDSPVALCASGLGGFGAVLCAAFDPRIDALIVADGLPSLRDAIATGGELEGPWLLPHFLQYADGGTLAALVAPRPMLLLASAGGDSRWRAGMEEAKPVAQGLYLHQTANLRCDVLERADPSSSWMADPEFAKRAVAFLESIPLDTEDAVRFEAPDGLPGPQRMSITEVSAADQWQSMQASIQQSVLTLLGGFPDRGPDHTATLVEMGAEDGFRWERLIVRTTPEHLMPVVVTRPLQGDEPLPALIHVSGYSISQDADALRLGAELAEHGFVGVFACPKTAMAYRLGGTPRDAIGILEGRPIVGQWAWNLMGLVDYLETRADIDADRLGAMGWSLGATTITYWMPFDERIKAGAGFVAFNQMTGLTAAKRTGAVSGADGTSYLEGHPLFNFVPGLLRHCDVDDFLATMAPRPLLSLAGERDEYFPHEVVRDIYRRQRHVYELLGVPERIDLLVYPGPHDMAPELRERAWAFFEEWLK